jgi:6-phosphogluconolactonase
MKIIFQLFLLSVAFAGNAQNSHLLVGTYTRGKSEGIYVYNFNSNTGDFALESKIKSPDPSYLAVSPNHKFVYAVNEGAGDKSNVTAFGFNRQSGELSLVNQQPSGGDNPCFVAVDKTGKWIAVANYTGGSLSVFPVQANGGIGKVSTFIQDTGSGANKQRQEKAHVHSSFFSKDNRYLFVADLGLDKEFIYSFNEKTGKLIPTAQGFAKSDDGSGPRHIDFHPSDKYIYLIEELTGTVVAYQHSNGKLTRIQRISAAKKDFTGFMGSADIHVSPDGKFLYCSNRGDANTITIFKINAATGKLTVIGYQSVLGKAPRNFSLDPSGNFLLVANQDSDNIIIFKRNKETGLLTDTGKKIEAGNPVCLKWIAK